MKATELELRGLMAQCARNLNKSLDSISRFDINKELKTKGLDALTGTEMAPIKEDLKKGPFPTHGPGKLVAFSFEYWFNYFFKELPSADQLVFALHVINDDGSLRSENQVPNLAAVFQAMLQKGFRKFTADDHMTATAIQAHASLDNPLQRTVNILFRGDSRLPQQIKTQGTRPQTQVDYLCQTRGMRKPWHPFLNNGDAVWVRNGEVNKDNCLFSAVSVTPQFFVATKFPLLDGLLGECPEQVGHAIVVVRDRPGAVVNRAAAHPGRPVSPVFERARQTFSQSPAAETGTERTIKLAASQTSIYGVIMRGAYNTQKYQGDAPFPEYASDNLEWSDHLVWFSVTRIHFGAGSANDGHLVVINKHDILQDAEVIKAALLGPHSWPPFNNFIADIVQRGSLRTGKGIEYFPPGVQPPPYEIVRVLQPFMKGKPQ